MVLRMSRKELNEKKKFLIIAMFVCSYTGEQLKLVSVLRRKTWNRGSCKDTAKREDG